MKIYIKPFWGLLLFLGLVASAQCEPQKIRPASSSDFVGYWRVVLLPDQIHKLVKNESMGFSGACRILVIKSDGSWHNLSINIAAGEAETLRQCPTQETTIDAVIAALPPSKYRWSKNQLQDGYFYARDTSKTDPHDLAGIAWKVDYVAEDVPAKNLFGFDLKKGEMIMQLLKPLGDNAFIPIWSMVLRPLQE